MSHNHITTKKILKNLQIIRKKLNLTQEDVANHFEISVKHVSELERGISNPSFSLLIEIINYYSDINGKSLNINKIFYDDLTP
ncbi:helix-turn-helix domain-containing protein [Aerococcus urinaeequi]|uniref:helix-turn-helix domain-containing protein n=1 Tax=Aerococcus urinaeequi TaxID=51665 RepID=UPI003AAC2B32